MEKTQAFFISKRLAEVKTAEEMATILSKEFGFNSSYLTLKDKGSTLAEINDSIREEQDIT